MRRERVSWCRWAQPCVWECVKRDVVFSPLSPSRISLATSGRSAMDDSLCAAQQSVDGNELSAALLGSRFCSSSTYRRFQVAVVKTFIASLRGLPRSRTRTAMHSTSPPITSIQQLRPGSHEAQRDDHATLPSPDDSNLEVALTLL